MAKIGNQRQNSFGVKPVGLKPEPKVQAKNFQRKRIVGGEPLKGGRKFSQEGIPETGAQKHPASHVDKEADNNSHAKMREEGLNKALDVGNNAPDAKRRQFAGSLGNEALVNQLNMDDLIDEMETDRVGEPDVFLPQNKDPKARQNNHAGEVWRPSVVGAPEGGENEQEGVRQNAPVDMQEVKVGQGEVDHASNIAHVIEEKPRDPEKSLQEKARIALKRFQSLDSKKKSVEDVREAVSDKDGMSKASKVKIGFIASGLLLIILSLVLGANPIILGAGSICLLVSFIIHIFSKKSDEDLIEDIYSNIEILQNGKDNEEALNSIKRDIELLQKRANKENSRERDFTLNGENLTRKELYKLLEKKLSPLLGEKPPLRRWRI